MTFPFSWTTPKRCYFGLGPIFFDSTGDGEQGQTFFPFTYIFVAMTVIDPEKKATSKKLASLGRQVIFTCIGGWRVISCWSLT